MTRNWQISVFQIGSTSVQLAETQMTIKSVPLNMDSTRTALIYNTGPNHTYYKVPPHACTHTQTHTLILNSYPGFVLTLQVLDVCPLPGMVVSPSEGVVPSGGNAALSINFNPDSVIKFDTRIEVKGHRRGNRRKRLYDHFKKYIDIHETCLLQIALRSMKSIELRVAGSVEPPKIDISVVSVPQYSVGNKRVTKVVLNLNSFLFVTVRV